jgi:hypothetical protein
LTAARTNLTNLNSTWTSDNLLSGGPDLALLGLTCNDIYAVETMDFILIMEHYNRLRKAVNKVQNYNYPKTWYGVLKTLGIYLCTVF